MKFCHEIVSDEHEHNSIINHLCGFPHPVFSGRSREYLLVALWIEQMSVIVDVKNARIIQPVRMSLNIRAMFTPTARTLLARMESECWSQANTPTDLAKKDCPKTWRPSKMVGHHQ